MQWQYDEMGWNMHGRKFLAYHLIPNCTVHRHCIQPSCPTRTNTHTLTHIHAHPHAPSCVHAHAPHTHHPLPHPQTCRTCNDRCVGPTRVLAGLPVGPARRPTKHVQTPCTISIYNIDIAAFRAASVSLHICIFCSIPRGTRESVRLRCAPSPRSLPQ